MAIQLEGMADIRSVAGQSLVCCTCHHCYINLYGPHYSGAGEDMVTTSA